MRKIDEVILTLDVGMHKTALMAQSQLLQAQNTINPVLKVEFYRRAALYAALEARFLAGKTAALERKLQEDHAPHPVTIP